MEIFSSISYYKERIHLKIEELNREAAELKERIKNFKSFKQIYVDLNVQRDSYYNDDVLCSELIGSEVKDFSFSKSESSRDGRFYLFLSLWIVRGGVKIFLKSQYWYVGEGIDCREIIDLYRFSACLPKTELLGLRVSSNVIAEIEEELKGYKKKK